MRERGTRALLSVVLFVVAAMLPACAARLTRWDEHVLKHAPDSGFVTLAVGFAPTIKVGTTVVVEDSDALADVWKAFGFRPPVPRVEFTKSVVAIFVVRHVCDDGPGGHELTRLTIRADGELVPAFIEDAFACYSGLRDGPIRGMAYALALPRARLPSGQDLRLETRRGRRAAIAADPEQSVRPIACVDAVPPEGSGPDGATLATIPRPGEISLQYLGDGTPVFVVRHADGGLSVLAADMKREWLADVGMMLRGLAGPLEWHCSYGRFQSDSGGYDEHGTPATPLVWRSIDRYPFRKVGDFLEVRVGERQPGTGPRAIASRPRLSFETDRVRLVPFEDRRAESVASARAEPIGTVVKLDARLAYGGGLPVRLCDRTQSDTGSGCPPDSPRAIGLVSLDPDAVFVLDGTFSARVTAAGFEQVILLGADRSPSLVRRLRPEPRRGAERWRFEGNLAALGALRSGDAALGLSLRGTAGHRVFQLPRSFGQWSVGQIAAVSLRARAMKTLGDPANELLFGIDPSLENEDSLERWSLVSPLGAVLPEGGLGVRMGRAFPYLGWTLPIGYRFLPRRWRQHPYELRDVLALEVSPAMLVTFEDPTRWIFGLSLGLTVW